MPQHIIDKIDHIGQQQNNHPLKIENKYFPTRWAAVDEENNNTNSDTDTETKDETEDDSDNESEDKDSDSEPDDDESTTSDSSEDMEDSDDDDDKDEEVAAVTERSPGTVDSAAVVEEQEINEDPQEDDQ